MTLNKLYSTIKHLHELNKQLSSIKQSLAQRNVIMHSIKGTPPNIFIYSLINFNKIYPFTLNAKQYQLNKTINKAD